MFAKRRDALQLNARGQCVVGSCNIEVNNPSISDFYNKNVLVILREQDILSTSHILTRFMPSLRLFCVWFIFFNFTVIFIIFFILCM